MIPVNGRIKDNTVRSRLRARGYISTNIIMIWHTTLSLQSQFRFMRYQNIALLSWNEKLKHTRLLQSCQYFSPITAYWLIVEDVGLLLLSFFPFSSSSRLCWLFSGCTFFKYPFYKLDNLQKIYPLSTTSFCCVENWRADFNKRRMEVKFSSTDWLSYMRTQLKVFVGWVCLRSRFLLASFSRRNIFTSSGHFRELKLERKLLVCS